jgi:Ca2+-binding RTX toxin-like protein
MAAPCADAGASTVTIKDSIVVFDGDDDSNNIIYYDAPVPGGGPPTGSYTIRQDDGPLTATAPCTNSGQPAGQAICPSAGVTSFHFAMDDGDDIIRGYDINRGLPAFIRGGQGNDSLGGGPGDDVITGGPGDDTLNLTLSNGRTSADGNDTIDGGDGNDTLNGGPGNDLLHGGGQVLEDKVLGDLVVTSGVGSDVFTGGDGRDRVAYALDSPITATMDGTAADDGIAGENDNIGADVEDLATGAGTDRITGNALGNRIEAGGGDDVVASGDGDDVLEGGPADPGNDSLDGQAGNDALAGGPGDDSLAGGDGLDSADGGGGTDIVEGGAGRDSVMGGAGADTAVRGGDGDDMVMGGAPALVGADGGDSLAGGDGDDAMLGGDGDDTFDGGQGGDLVKGEAGDDSADYTRRLGAVTVSLDAAANDGIAREGDNVDSDVELVKGGQAGDTLMGNGGPNGLTGGAGEDYIDGGGGGDVLAGGDSGDVIRSRNGSSDNVSCGDDRADFVIADAADEVDSDCARVDTGVAQRPASGRRVLMTPLAGAPTMSPSGISREVPLQDRLLLPVGSLVNATGGRVRLGAAGGQSGDFRGGAFRVRQSRGGRPLTELRLTGGDLVKACKAGARASATRPRRRLFADARGRFRTRGRNSSATVRGTRWVTQDTCAGTLTTVSRGSVAVRDFRLRKTRIVRAGQRYLARP